MVSRKKILGLDFKSIDEYYQYILDSVNNGQPRQAQRLYNNLSAKQRKDFELYCLDFLNHEEMYVLINNKLK